MPIHTTEDILEQNESMQWQLDVIFCDTPPQIFISSLLPKKKKTQILNIKYNSDETTNRIGPSFILEACLIS